jgi:hypothetical protein
MIDKKKRMKDLVNLASAVPNDPNMVVTGKSFNPTTMAYSIRFGQKKYTPKHAPSYNAETGLWIDPNTMTTKRDPNFVPKPERKLAPSYNAATGLWIDPNTMTTKRDPNFVPNSDKELNQLQRDLMEIRMRRAQRASEYPGSDLSEWDRLLRETYSKISDLQSKRDRAERGVGANNVGFGNVGFGVGGGGDPFENIGPDGMTGFAGGAMPTFQFAGDQSGQSGQSQPVEQASPQVPTSQQPVMPSGKRQLTREIALQAIYEAGGDRDAALRNLEAAGYDTRY